MKKVLSVAMASAMVLGMGANAFAIEYSTGSNDKASWPKGFAFEGSLFVTNADDEIVKESTTAINKKQNVNFEPGDTIWMPLYADDQLSYTAPSYVAGKDEVAASSVTLAGVENPSNDGEIKIDRSSRVQAFNWVDNSNKVVYYYTGSDVAVNKTQIGSYKAADGWRFAQLFSKDLTTYVNGTQTTTLVGTVDKVTRVNMTLADAGIAAQDAYLEEKTDTAVASNKVTLTLDGTVYEGYGLNYTVVSNATDVAFSMPAEAAQYLIDKNANDALKEKNPVAKDFSVSGLTVSDTDKKATIPVTTVIGQMDSVSRVTGVLPGVTVRVALPKVAGVTESIGSVDPQKDSHNTVFNKVAHGHYTGNIDKNWSINLIEKDGTVADLVEKAELYKADEADYLSYKGATTEIKPNAVYLKVTLKDEWKTTKSETLKYYVYVADNKSEKADNKTNEVWVSGTYENTDFEYVNFDWSNDASRAKLWKVRKDESGKAVFDFADKAFFTVKMYGGETMYLDLKTAYDKAIAGEMDAEADSFYKFDGSNANFARSGELVIVSDDDTLVPYEIDEDGNFVEVDAEYVKDYKIAGINKKVNGFKFDTKQLGNYVLSTEELGAEEEVAPEEDEEPADNEPAEEETPEVEETPETNKPNPETGAEDFVGLAVSLAVVSVAAAGALALKK